MINVFFYRYVSDISSVKYIELADVTKLEFDTKIDHQEDIEETFNSVLNIKELTTKWLEDHYGEIHISYRCKASQRVKCVTKSNLKKFFMDMAENKVQPHIRTCVLASKDFKDHTAFIIHDDISRFFNTRDDAVVYFVENYQDQYSTKDDLIDNIENAIKEVEVK